VRFGGPLDDFGGAQVDAVDRAAIYFPASNVGEAQEELSNANDQFRVMITCNLN